MALILLGKRLLADTSSQEAARVRLILDREGIPYRQRTLMIQHSAMRAANTAAYAKANLPVASTDRQQQGYVYIVTVRRRDYDRARRVAFGGK